MEICFDNKIKNTYIETGHICRRIQEHAECVVPDVNDDIGRIASTQTEIMLKGKELNSRGLCVSGEINASVLYITENENKVSYVNTSKSFEIYFDTGDAADEMLSHIKLSVVNSEARALNPRKLSLSFDISGELYCYKESSTELETIVGDAQAQNVHLKYESLDIMTVSAVCEKSFAISEQLLYPSGKASPSQLICKKADFTVTDTQIIGSKAIIKGNVNVSVMCSSDELCYPVCSEFSLPFSQIIDTGKDEIDSCSVTIQQTSSYYRLVDTINGEKAIDSEIHAVIQLVCRSRQTVRYISDAYSNLMPVVCSVSTRQFDELCEPQRFRLNAEEHISIAEDCADVLNVFPSISQWELSGGKLRAALQFDVIYRNTGGGLAAVRRGLETECECALDAPRLDSISLSDINLRSEGALIESRVCVEAVCRQCRKTEINALNSLELNEDEAYDFSQFPSISLVRVENEELWQLAKAYHSSVEQISSKNDISQPMSGRMLLIPKTV